MSDEATLDFDLISNGAALPCRPVEAFPRWLHGPVGAIGQRKEQSAALSRRPRKAGQRFHSMRDACLADKQGPIDPQSSPANRGDFPARGALRTFDGAR